MNAFQSTRTQPASAGDSINPFKLDLDPRASARVIPASASADTVEQRLDRIENVLNALAASVMNLAEAGLLADNLFVQIGVFMKKASQDIDAINAELETTTDVFDNIFDRLQAITDNIETGPEYGDVVDGSSEAADNLDEVAPAQVRLIAFDLPELVDGASAEQIDDAIDFIFDQARRMYEIGVIGSSTTLVTLLKAGNLDASLSEIAKLPQGYNPRIVDVVIREWESIPDGGTLTLPWDEQAEANVVSTLLKAAVILQLLKRGIPFPKALF